MTEGNRTALTLVGCLAALAVGGTVALSALQSYSGPPTREAKVTVQVEGRPSTELVQLRTVDVVRAGPVTTPTVVPAGTLLDVVDSASDSAALPPAVPVGARLLCDVRVRQAQGDTPVVDVVHCVPSGSGGSPYP